MLQINNLSQTQNNLSQGPANVQSDSAMASQFSSSLNALGALSGLGGSNANASLTLSVMLLVMQMMQEISAGNTGQQGQGGFGQQFGGSSASASATATATATAGGATATSTASASAAAGGAGGSAASASAAAAASAGTGGGSAASASAAAASAAVVQGSAPVISAAPAPSQPALSPIAVGEGSATWGDPHFLGAEGGRYDVQGKPGKVYNMLSDKGMQLNAKFDKSAHGGKTVVSQAGFTLGEDQVAVKRNGVIRINGQKIQGDGTYLDGKVIVEGDKVTVCSEEYNVTVNIRESKRGIPQLRLDYQSNNVVADGVKPHGLWGQTADGDGKPRDGDKGKGSQGGGAIENLNGMTQSGDKNAVGLYEVDGIFDTHFENFNRF